MGADITIQDMRAEDWPQIRRIYEEGIATRDATFEQEVPSWESWDGSHVAEPRLVARLGEAVVGWSALAAVSPRRVYRGVAEVSTYVGREARGRGGAGSGPSASGSGSAGWRAGGGTWCCWSVAARWWVDPGQGECFRC